jgi:hypothetical protein
MDGSEHILQKLEAALNADGDFPVRAKAVIEMRKLVGDPNTPVEKIVEVILGEPSLGTRILHLVNSVFYQRKNPVMTISQAVVQLGMRALTDLCTGLVLMQRFSPVARRGGIFADNVKKTILTSLLASSIADTLGDEEEERGYLAGTFFSIGPLLLAYYFPQVFESAERRAKKRRQTITQSITETLGIPPVALSLGIIDSLSIPEYYRELLLAAYSIYVGDFDEVKSAEHNALAQSLAIAGKLSDAIVDTQTRPELLQAFDQLLQHAPISKEQLQRILAPIPESFNSQAKVIDMTFLTLPEHFLTYVEHGENNVVNQELLIDDQDDGFSYYIDEIKEAIRNQETLSSVIATVMEALAFGLNFDRVILLFSDLNGTLLRGKMSLGKPFGVSANEFVRTIEASNTEGTPEAAAFFNGTVEVFGDPLFVDGWPFAAIPIGEREHAVGIIYADIIENAEQPGVALTDKDQAALSILAELLDRAATASGID